MKSKTVIAGLLLLGLAVSFHEPASRVGAGALRAARSLVSGTEPPSSELAARLGKSAREAEASLRGAYLEASLAESGDAVTAALATLGGGLESGDEDVRRGSAEYVENLLIPVAHGKVSVNPDNQKALGELVALYKAHAHERIQQLRAAYPESPTLAYLRIN
jgi:hypothetical protein